MDNSNREFCLKCCLWLSLSATDGQSGQRIPPEMLFAAVPKKGAEKGIELHPGTDKAPVSKTDAVKARLAK